MNDQTKSRFAILGLIYLISTSATLAAVDSSQPPQLQENQADTYDGSEFKASTYIDSSFDKPDYRGERSKVSKMLDRSLKADGEMSKKSHSEEGVKGAEGEDSKLDKKNIGEMLGEVSGPVHELAGDWVPDKIDPTSNGGFEISPDNGSPVPYRLNGHVDIERGRPWEAN